MTTVEGCATCARSGPLTTVTGPQIEAALKELYPDGTADVGETELLRTIFVHVMRRH